MTELLALWLPILLSSVLVFVASSIIHMVSPWHTNDYPRVPNEDRLMDAVRPLAIPAGDYMVPRPASGKEMRSPEFLEKLNKGPVMMITMMPNGMMSMARNLSLWFLYIVVISVFAAFVAGSALAPGRPYLHVFHFIALTAFLGYSAAL